MFITLQPFLISMLIGFIIGIERERTLPEQQQILGVRTFILISLFGSLTAWSQNYIFMITGLVLVAGFIFIGYYRYTQKYADRGLTTEIAGLVVYCLSIVTFQNKILGITLGLFTAFVLFSKEKLHKFSRQTLKSSEYEAIIILLTCWVVFIPTLPEQLPSPWNFFSPQKTMILITMIAGIQFLSYLGIRIFGLSIGNLLSGFLGGLISSTAVFINLPKNHHGNLNILKSYIESGLIATVAMALELILVLYIGSIDIFQSMALPLTAMSLCGLGLIVLNGNGQTDVKIIQQKPLEVASVLKTSFFIICCIFIINLIVPRINPGMTYAVSFLSGLFELHGTSLGLAIAHSNDKIEEIVALQNILVAVFASNVTKLAILLLKKNMQLFFRMSVYLILIYSCGLITYLMQGVFYD